jgi:very-short-patch-repair endonuclease
MGTTDFLAPGSGVPESPIERGLFDGLSNFTRWMGDRGVTVSLQEWIGPYRADFVLRMPGRVPLVVECDGKYHDQAERLDRDRARDRSMVEAGWRVYRIQGAHLWRYPTLCARLALRALSNESLDLIEENVPGHLQEQQEERAERIRLELPCACLGCGSTSCDHGRDGHDCDAQCAADHRTEE